jgi:hypothetical protein
MTKYESTSTTKKAPMAIVSLASGFGVDALSPTARPTSSDARADCPAVVKAE